MPEMLRFDPDRGAKNQNRIHRLSRVALQPLSGSWSVAGREGGKAWHISEEDHHRHFTPRRLRVYHSGASQGRDGQSRMLQEHAFVRKGFKQLSTPAT